MLKTIKQFYISRKSSIFASRKHKGKHIVEQFKKIKRNENYDTQRKSCF